MRTYIQNNDHVGATSCAAHHSITLRLLSARIDDANRTVMHFAKSYAHLLLSLPPRLRENAINYRQASSSFSLTSSAF